jgi:hypothetical protein
MIASELRLLRGMRESESEARLSRVDETGEGSGHPR